jgi:GH25 family lysozyme M1 (1,4-beta-N-acetylmuramidase)
MTDPRSFGFWEPIDAEDLAMLQALIASSTAKGRTERVDVVREGTWHVVTLSKPIAVPVPVLPLGPSETGIDVSRWNNSQTVIDFAKVKAAGHRFVFIKRTQGTGWVDPLGLGNFNAARPHMDFISNYHFFEWRVDGAAQAEHFSRTCGEAVGNLAELVDVELQPNEDPAAVNKALAETNLRAFLVRCEQLFGRRPLIYTSRHYWMSMFDTGRVADIGAGYKYLIADWTPPLDLPPGIAWAHFHQKRSDYTIPGLAGPFDLDEYRGDPPPPSALHPLTHLTNQQVINLFSRAFGAVYIDKIVAALDETTVFQSRLTLFTGPPIEQLPALTDAEKAQLVAALV